MVFLGPLGPSRVAVTCVLADTRPGTVSTENEETVVVSLRRPHPVCGREKLFDKQVSLASCRLSGQAPPPWLPE